MRDKISVLFFIIATGLILAHIGQTALALNIQSEQNAIYRVLRSTKAPVILPAEVDYKRLAELNAGTSKAEGW